MTGRSTPPRPIQLFKIGEAVTPAEGNRREHLPPVTLSESASEACEMLEEKASALKQIINIHTIKPWTFRQSYRSARGPDVLSPPQEEHQVSGGLGDDRSEYWLQFQHPVPQEYSRQRQLRGKLHAGTVDEKYGWKRKHRSCQPNGSSAGASLNSLHLIPARGSAAQRGMRRSTR